MRLHPERTVSILQRFILDNSPRQKEHIKNPNFTYTGNQLAAMEIGEVLKNQNYTVEQFVCWLSDKKSFFLFSDTPEAKALRQGLIQQLTEEALFQE